eukprot:Hpha_TRINITY_DN15142_c2_g2::TRINITY_DN15142_c2_g2_i2::g.129827::m.129827
MTTAVGGGGREPPTHTPPSSVCATAFATLPTECIRLCSLSFHLSNHLLRYISLLFTKLNPLSGRRQEAEGSFFPPKPNRCQSGNTSRRHCRSASCRVHDVIEEVGKVLADARLAQDERAPSLLLLSDCHFRFLGWTADRAVATVAAPLLGDLFEAASRAQLQLVTRRRDVSSSNSWSGRHAYTYREKQLAITIAGHSLVREISNKVQKL